MVQGLPARGTGQNGLRVLPPDIEFYLHIKQYPHFRAVLGFRILPLMQAASPIQNSTTMQGSIPIQSSTLVQGSALSAGLFCSYWLKQSQALAQIQGSRPHLSVGGASIFCDVIGD